MRSRRSIPVYLGVFVVVALVVAFNTDTNAARTPTPTPTLTAGPAYFLIIYKDDGFRKPMGAFAFDGSNAFRAWSNSQEDELSSFVYRIPPGWVLRIFKHGENKAPFQDFACNGQVQHVDKKNMIQEIHDDASAHMFIKVR